MRKYWSREEGEFCIEDAPSEDKLRILYTTVVGRILLKTIFARRWFSFLAGIYYKSHFSKNKLKEAMGAAGNNDPGENIGLPNKQGYISSTEENRKYKSFNEYFSRKEDRISTAKEGDLISPADSRMMVYNIKADLTLPVKNSRYSIEELLGGKSLFEENLAKEFAEGYCLVYRLTLGDYHRYSYIDNGVVEKNWKVKGLLNTVRPIEGSKEVYFRNAREVTVIETKNFGKIVQIEIGAMLVGKIQNHKRAGQVRFMEEKGYFEYGGSTIVQLLKKEVAEIDRDIVEMSGERIETKVNIGEKVGICLKG